MSKAPAVHKGPIIATYDLRKDFEGPHERLSVLRGVDFEFHRGQMSFVIGRSGSGKSTFLHLLGGLDEPSSGKILFEGEDITELSEKKMARIRNRRLGFVFQFYHLLPELTLFENVLLPSMITGKRDEKWAKEVIRKVKLASRQDHYPSELSGGEKQRAAIARALANHPSVVLCDEPTGNLDQETSESIFSLIEDLNQRDGQAFLIVTHDEAVAWRYQHVLRLVDGVLIPAEQEGKDLQNVTS